MVNGGGKTKAISKVDRHLRKSSPLDYSQARGFATRKDSEMLNSEPGPSGTPPMLLRCFPTLSRTAKRFKTPAPTLIQRRSTPRRSL